MKALLIGDSIRIGYCGLVKEKLKETIDVRYFDDNCRFAKNILFFIKEWIDCYCPDADIIVLNSGQWDVVHINGAPYNISSIDEYLSDLEKIIGQIKNALPNAKIIWATTTPVDEPASRVTRLDHLRFNKDIVLYNERSVELMNFLGVEICDLYKVIIESPNPVWSDGIHFNGEGNELLSNAVAEKLLSVAKSL